ncbi:21836_t:CDS:2 [Cetraspora pellucida]|uniref:21836_t:CDS:1 n=1 Tax=Cetraspora pellucida TaxID=1433469 RepID=A0A9N8W3Y6_9GLOM|nr:21836_t:CDS:2 [Cetraspora pellucida]
MAKTLEMDKFQNCNYFITSIDAILQKLKDFNKPPRRDTIQFILQKIWKCVWKIFQTILKRREGDNVGKLQFLENVIVEKVEMLGLWAIGTYSVGREDNEIEVILYVPCHHVDRDLESQAIFKRDEYYSVSGKIVSNYYSGNIGPKGYKSENSVTVPLIISYTDAFGK